ncbi:hypothetical protein AU188_17270 [Mycobacterium sp. IS-3022]|nr:hypothetical protein AU188_17270 [Mycobacterium sp. IS-3022]
MMRAAAKVFAEKGFSSATVRDVADEAEVLSGNLYYYFESKEAIVEEVLCGYLDLTVTGYRRAAEEPEDAVTALTGLMSVALRGLAHHRYELMILQNDWHYVGPMERVAKYMDEIEKIWLATIDRGVAEGAFRADIDVRMAYRTIMGAIQSAVRWFDTLGKLSVDDLISVQSSILLDGLRAAP